jgi:hypothetical protein
MGFIVIAAGIACIAVSVIKRIESALFRGLGLVILAIGVLAVFLL